MKRQRSMIFCQGHSKREFWINRVLRFFNQFARDFDYFRELIASGPLIESALLDITARLLDPNPGTRLKVHDLYTLLQV